MIPGRGWRRAGFILFAVVLGTATHWPNVVIEGPVPRPDLFVHIAAFGLWTLLLIATEWAGPWRSRGSLLRAAGIGAGYAAIDELTQGIPGLNRVVDPMDLAANVAGVLLACAAAAAAVRLLPDRSRRSDDVDTLAQNTATVAGLTFASRVFGLARDLVLVRVFGDSVVGSAFNAAFALPNMFRRLFGEGALSGAFIPRYTKLAGSDAEDPRPRLSDRYASLIAMALITVTSGVTVLGELGLLLWSRSEGLAEDTQYSIALMMIMLPLMPLVCVTAVLGGVLQVRGSFAVPASVPIVLNLCVIAGGLAALWTGVTPMEAGRLVAWATLAAGVVQLGWVAATLRRHLSLTTSFTGAWAHGRATLAAFVPVVIGMGTLQLNTLMDTVLAMWPTWFGPEMFGRTVPMDESSNAVLGFTQRLYQFPLGVFGIAVATAAFPQLSRTASDPGRFADTLARGVRLSLFIGLPASAGLFLVRDDLVRVMFSGGNGFSDQGLQRAAAVLAGYSLAVWAFSLNHLLVRAFYAREDTRTPTAVSLTMVGVNLALNLTLIWTLREAGLAWATAVTASLQTVVLIALLRRRVSFGPVLLPIMHHLLGVAGMVACVLGLRWALGAPETWIAAAARLAGSVAIGGGVYLGLSLALGSSELRWLLGRTRGGT
ncbi:MAG: murein biosynthesis integral membrane protein MurJ [Planctomycetota bacterium]